LKTADYNLMTEKECQDINYYKTMTGYYEEEEKEL
jgi:hypothetical protein